MEGISLQGRLMLARHEVALREAQARALSELPGKRVADATAFRHVRWMPGVSDASVVIVTAWGEGPLSHRWHLTVPIADATSELLWSLERMARRRAGQLLQLVK